MPDSITLRIDGRSVTVPRGTMLAVAMIVHGGPAFGRAPDGSARGPLCAMGSCFECRVTVDGVEDVRACQLPCTEGMEVERAGA